MFCPNRISDENVKQMRESVLQHKKHIIHYQKLYSGECKKTTVLMKEITNLKNHIRHSENEIVDLQSKPEKKPRQKCKRKQRELKQWSNIVSERTKRRCFTLYKDMIFDTLCKIGVCHRAEVTLWMQSNRVQFSWCPKNFNADMQTNKCLNEPDILPDHTYFSKPLMQDEENFDDFQDLNYSEIFDNHGNWEKLHIRRLVHVLDTFRISHEAYHELRMVSKGHLPPISRLTKEKKLMSEEIPYIKEDKVSTLRSCSFERVQYYIL